jgi:hypothetical protein
MESAPTSAEIADAVGISRSYAAMILSDSSDPDKSRTPPRSLAIAIYRATHWLHPSIAGMTEVEMKVFERHDPWIPPKERQAA